jgi:hypothetical protein
MATPDLLEAWLKNRAVRDTLSSLRSLATSHDVEIVVSKAGVDVRPMPKSVTTTGDNKQHGKRGLFAKPLKT